jgi:hypothetical protein
MELKASDGANPGVCHKIPELCYAARSSSNQRAVGPQSGLCLSSATQNEINGEILLTNGIFAYPGSMPRRRRVNVAGFTHPLWAGQGGECWWGGNVGLKWPE